MNDTFEISSEKTLLDIPFIVAFIQSSYWGGDRSEQEIRTSLKHSLCFGVYLNQKQIGFARVVTDQAFFGFLADVFIIEDYRGLGYGQKLVKFVMKDKRLQSIRRFMLATKDAHSLYESYGFERLNAEDQENLMRLRTKLAL
jgi:N-acetylglutamate synthase-like GNAT family acetyltransferase